MSRPYRFSEATLESFNFKSRLKKQQPFASVDEPMYFTLSGGVLRLNL